MKTIKACLLILLLSTALPTIADDYIFDIEGMHASIEFRVKHLGYSWLHGRFNRFDGHFSYDSDQPEASSVSVTIDTQSLDSNHATRDKHLRGEDFLDTEQFPDASFQSTRIESADGGKLIVHGNLTLHGVTREIAINAQKIGAGADPWGGFRMGFRGTTQFALADFGITKYLGPHSKQVELVLNVEGIRQDKDSRKKR